MAILATQKVLTLDYWKIAEDLKPGDIVFDKLGNRTTIKLVQCYRAQNCYRVWFSDGLSAAGDAHLKPPLETEYYRKLARMYKGKKKFVSTPTITPISKLFEMSLDGRDGRHEYSVPAAGPLDFPHQTLPVPPFIFGFWFFNRLTNGLMRIEPEHREFVFEKFHDAGYKVIEKNKTARGAQFFTTQPTVISHLKPHVPTKIPNNYLLASAEQRIELLKGIVHFKKRTFIEKTGMFRVATAYDLVAKQVQYLAESLGCKTKRSKYLTNQVFIRTRLPLIERHTPKENKVRQNWRYVVEVVEIQAQGCVHIETTNPDTGFLVGEGFIACQ